MKHPGFQMNCSHLIERQGTRQGRIQDCKGLGVGVGGLEGGGGGGNGLRIEKQEVRDCMNM